MISDEMLLAISTDGCKVGYAVDIISTYGESRIHTGLGSLSINGNVYSGVGTLGSIGQIPVTSDDKPTRLAMSLSGLPVDFLPQALQKKMRGADVTLYMIAFNEDETINLAEVIFVGFITAHQVNAGRKNSIDITVGDEFERYEIPWSEYWTDNSMQHSHDGDRICRFTAQISDREINWGSKADAAAFTYVS